MRNGLNIAYMKDYFHNYYIENKEHEAEQMKLWRENNRDYSNEKMKERLA